MKVTIFIRDNTDNSDEAACKDIRGFCLRISARVTIAKWLVSKPLRDGRAPDQAANAAAFVIEGLMVPLLSSGAMASADIGGAK